jgi:hypothetical protein
MGKLAILSVILAFVCLIGSSVVVSTSRHDWYYFNGYSSSDVIAEGNVTGWDPTGDANQTSRYIPVVIHMQVRGAIKGSVPANLDILDTGSVYQSDGAFRWLPEQCDDCGPARGFQADPTGKYFVLGLDHVDDDASPGRFHKVETFYQGVEPGEYNDEYDSAIARIAKDRVEAMQDDFVDGLAIGLLAAMAVLLILPWFLLRARKIQRESAAALRAG